MLHALTVNYSSCLLFVLGFATRKAVGIRCTRLSMSDGKCSNAQIMLELTLRLPKTFLY